MPRVAASLGFSGSLSITRNRYSNGHCMKSLARDGESEAGATAVTAATLAVTASPGPLSGPDSGLVPGPDSVLVSMSHDDTARH
ncbi:hypothetical protein GCM10010431_31330 [Streptomyces kunmingensis]